MARYRAVAKEFSMLSTLTQRATLLARTLAPDGGGGFTESWDAFATVWIALDILGATDTVDADRLQSRIRHRIVLRRRADLAAGQRVQVGARTFRVHAVLDDGPRAQFTTLNCEELP
jgi:SPP1 family predicted phage head-tail adaptor